jgi:dynein heavy chain
MVSVEGELIPLKTRIKPSQANGAVEKWLVQVEAGMVESVREQCQKGLLAYPAIPRSQWVLQWPGQVVLTVTAIFWTQEVTAAVSSTVAGSLRKQADRCTSQLNDVVELVRGELSNLNR